MDPAVPESRQAPHQRWPGDPEGVGKFSCRVMPIPDERQQSLEAIFDLARLRVHVLRAEQVV